MTDHSKTLRPRRGLALAFGALAFLVLIALGTWQVQRLHWKEALIATIEARVKASPMPLADLAAAARAGEDIDYVPVTASGVLLNDKEQFFFATHDGKSGWYVYTPLRLPDRRVVLVNRGFIPYEQKDPSTRPGSQPSGTVHVTGLARPKLDGKPSSMVPDNDPAKNIFYWKDLAAMAANAGLQSSEVEPFFVDAIKGPDANALPVGGVTIIDLPNSHLQYAITWYGLAAALVGVLAAWLWRTRSR